LVVNQLRNDVKKLMIFDMVILLLGTSCLAADPVSIDKESSVAILENLTANSSNQSSDLNATNSTLANSSLNLSSSPAKKSNSDLWGWGKTPMGHGVDSSGNLVDMRAREEWKPSI